MNVQKIGMQNIRRDELLELIPANLSFILKIRLFIPIWLFMISLALADAPHSRILEMMKNGTIEMPYYLQNLEELRDRGINTPAILPDGRRVPGPPRNTEVNYNAIAILVDFSDNVSQVTGSFFDNLMYGTGNGTVRHYYDEVTYGNLTVVTLNLPSSLGWLRAPQTYAYYVNSNNGFGNYPQNAQKLAEDVIALADPLVDFSQYDNDGDGYVDALFIIHSGPGAEFTGNNNDIWSHKWATFSPQWVDGVYAYIYSMEPEYWQNPGDMTCGVYAHEMGHSVFGLPDVYDRDGSSRGLGRWSLMAGGSWNGSLGNSPAHPDAWNRMQMGYVTPRNITTDTTGYSLPNIQNNQSMVRLWTQGNVGNQYFLVENRQRLGYDAALPQAGICIYHVDESVNTQNDREWYPGHISSGHYLVALEQADGLWQLEMNSNSGNSGDPFPGSTNNRTFDHNSTPDSRNYSFQNTQVAVRNISNSAMTMQADFEVGIPQIAPDIDISPSSFSFTVQENDTSSDTLVISNTGNGDLSWTISELNDIGSGQLTSPVDASWLSENPTAGTVIPGGNQFVTLLVDATGLTAGSYSCDLSINSNDPDEDPLIVPIYLTVTAVVTNQIPVAQNDVAETDEDLEVTVDVLANDNDPDGSLDVSSVTIVSDPFHGIATVNTSDGTVLFQPNADFHGFDQFSYTVDDNLGATSDTAQVAVTVHSVNDPPILTNIPDVQFDEDGQYLLPLNPYVWDVDHDSTQIHFASLVIMASAIASKSGLRSVLVDPSDLIVDIDPLTHHARFSSTLDSSGIFSVIFLVQDDSSATDTDTITVTVSAQNDPPLISALSDLTFDEDDTLDVPNTFWHNFVHDPDHPDTALTYQIESGRAVSVHLESGYHRLYANPNWYGQDTLLLIVSDPFYSDSAGFLVHVSSVNDPPVISGLPDTLRFQVDSLATLMVWNFVEDIETPDHLLNYQFTVPPQTVLLNFDPNTGSLEITPDAGFSGITSLLLEVWDDSSAFTQGNIIIKVEPLLAVNAEGNPRIPTRFILDQNYPNPFNPTTTIRYGLVQSVSVSIKIYNLLGQEVCTLMNGNQDAGYYLVTWDGLDDSGIKVASGIYIYRIQAGEYIAIRKMVLMK